MRSPRVVEPGPSLEANEGIHRARRSNDAVALRRAEDSSALAARRRNTSMVIESKYTSPALATVAQALAAKPTRIPSETGPSMPSRRNRRSARADEKNGPQAK